MPKAYQHAIGVALFAAVVAAIPLLTDNGFYLKVLFLIGVNYLAASGLNVLVSYTGQKSLGHAGLFAVGAYTAALLTAKLQWNPWLAFAAAGAMAGVFGIFIALPALRVKGPALAMVTIGFGVVVEKIVSEWQDVFAGQQGIYGVLPLTFSGSMLNSQQWVWLVLILGILTHLMLRALLQGKFGRAFMAVNTAEVAAESVGVSVYKYKVLAFVISAVTCGYAGALIAQQNQYINSDFITFNLSIFILLIVLFGGRSVYGPLLSAIVLTVLDAFLARWPTVQHFTYGALLLFALYVMPDGLSGAVAKLLGRAKASALPAGRPLAPAVRPAQASGTSGTAGAAALLRTESLYKAYGGVVPTNHVDIDIHAGRIYSLIGPNGAGKTTLLNILSGIVTPSEGKVAFLGRSIVGKPTYQICQMGLGRTFQNLRLFTDMSVIDNVKVGLHQHIPAGFFTCLWGLPAAHRAEAQATQQAADILQFLGLHDKAFATAGSLPYGLQRRVELARALATRPQLLLLDEPAAGLNPQETAELIEVIRNIREQGITVLLIEHHMDLVMAISDHVIVLEYGEKIAEGPPAAIQNDPRVIAAYLGAEDDAPPAPTAHATNLPNTHSTTPPPPLDATGLQHV